MRSHAHLVELSSLPALHTIALCGSNLGGTETGLSIYRLMAKQLDSIDSPCKIVEILIGTALRSHDDFIPLKDICNVMDQKLLSDNFPSFRCLRIDQEAFDYFPYLNSRGMLEAMGFESW